MKLYLLWSNEHKGWWRPGSLGYTSDRRAAGRYTQEDAIRISLRAADAGSLDRAECMVVDDWESE